MTQIFEMSRSEIAEIIDLSNTQKQPFMVRRLEEPSRTTKADLNLVRSLCGSSPRASPVLTMKGNGDFKKITLNPE